MRKTQRGFLVFYKGRLRADVYESSINVYAQCVFCFFVFFYQSSSIIILKRSETGLGSGSEVLSVLKCNRTEMGMISVSALRAELCGFDHAWLPHNPTESVIHSLTSDSILYLKTLLFGA